MRAESSVLWKVLAPVGVLFVLGLALIALYVPSVVEHIVREDSKAAASQTVDQLKALRAYYTEAVVSKVLAASDMTLSVNHADSEAAIPLPATLVHDLGERYSVDGNQLFVYSALPFPNRSGQPLQGFRLEAWDYLTANPAGSFVREETSADGHFVRVAIADRMTEQACVACHNAHPDSPRNDWRLGDVRGVLEVRRQIDPALERGQQATHRVLGALAGVLALLAAALAAAYHFFVGSRLRIISASLGRVADGVFVARERELDKLRGERNEIGGMARHVLDLLGELRRQRGEISAQERHSREQLAHFDALTGLPNRNHFKRQLEQHLDSARRHDQQVALMFIELDGLRQLTATHGNEAGEALLKSVAERIGGALRSSDVLGRQTLEGDETELDDALSAHLGGDEFSAIVHPVTAASDVAAAATRIIEVLAESIDVRGDDIVCTPSIGVAVYPDDADNANELLIAANSAMREARRAGSNRFALYGADMEAELRARIKMEQRLRKAIDEDALEVHYQPVVNASSGEPVAVEALVRWHDESLGTVPADTLIALAVEAGLIDTLDDFVTRAACKQIVRWRREISARLYMCVNGTGIELHADDFVDRLRGILNSSGLEAGGLQLEVSEQAMVSAGPNTAARLAEVKRLGVRLAIDDFGTSATSLADLKGFELNVLKMDQRLVNNIDQDPNTRAVASATVALARALELATVAEGVETQAERAVLDKLGFEMAQGQLYAPAMPAEECEQWLLKNMNKPEAPKPAPRRRRRSRKRRRN